MVDDTIRDNVQNDTDLQDVDSQDSKDGNSNSLLDIMTDVSKGSQTQGTMTPMIPQPSITPTTTPVSGSQTPGSQTPGSQTQGTMTPESMTQGSMTPRTLEPLKFWTQAEKEFFAKLQPNDQKTVLDMYKNTQRVYERKTLDVAQKGKEYQAYEEILKPYEPYFKNNNVNKVDYVNNLINTDRFATERPLDFVVNFMERTGITADILADALERNINLKNDPLYSYVAPLEQQIQNLSYQSQQLQKQLEAQRDNVPRDNDPRDNVPRDNVPLENINSAIDTFRRTQDEAGNLKYPYFDALQEQMAQLSLSTGETDLEKLYNRALWHNGSITQGSITPGSMTQGSLTPESGTMSPQTAQTQHHNQKAKVAASLNFKNSTKVTSSKAIPLTLEEVIRQSELEGL